MQKIKKIVSEWRGNKTVWQYSMNTVWMFAARCSWIITAFTVGIFVTRKLGPERLGVLSYAMAWISMFAIILDLGVTSIIQRDLVCHPENKNRVLGNFAMFKVIQCGIMYLIAGTALAFSGQSEEVIKLILILMVGYCTIFSTAIVPYFAAIVKNEYEAFSQITACLIYNAVRVCAVIFDWPLTAYAAAEAVVNISHHLPLLFFYRKLGNSFREWTFRFKEVFALLLPAVPLSLSGIFSTIYSRTDILMLEHFNGFKDVGFYSLATRFHLNLALFYGLLATIFSTAVSSAMKVSELEYKKQLHRFYFMLFWFMIPCFPLFWLIAPHLFKFLYGEEFITAAAIFSIFVCSLPCTGILNAFFWHCTFENKLLLLAISNGMGAVLNLFGNCYLIPKMGVAGAAWSSVISMPIGLFLSLLCTKKGRTILKFILKSLIILPSFKLNHSGT
ncbi:MAG: flippase [Lentisphaeria bacterium]|nr:flippase [Lentisphaeria bacterium]